MGGAGGPFGMRFSTSAGRRAGSMHAGVGASSKPRAYERDLVCSLEELYTGTTKKMKIGRTRFHNGQPVKEDSVVTVDVKAGWKEGTKITFAGEGGQEAPNGPPGDLVFVVKCRPHARFVRDGSHLIYPVPLPLLKALTGFTVPVVTLDNRTLHVKVDEIVSPKFRKIVPGEGMPISKKPGEKGDLILEFDISFPRRLTDEQKAKLREILGNS
uniref:HSP40 n=1 Tax=Eimeria stiedai TaxID=471275 RepID=A0A9E8AE18_9EIME|nr:HSP40 [Eimeria stiedai]